MSGERYRLRRCPFCGEKPELWEIPFGWTNGSQTQWQVICGSGAACPGLAGTKQCETKEEAVELWNTRAPQEAAEKRNRLRDIFDPTPEQQKRWRESYEKIVEKLKKDRCCDFCQNAKFEPHYEHGMPSGFDCICGITGELRIFPGDNGKNCEHWELAPEEEK